MLGKLMSHEYLPVGFYAWVCMCAANTSAHNFLSLVVFDTFAKQYECVGGLVGGCASVC